MHLWFKPKHPRPRIVYAVTKGAFLGELLVYAEDKAEQHCFLSMPQMINRDVPKDKFELGLKEKIVEIVEKIPSGIYKMCILQYKKNQRT